jgi:hypothetical protein
MQEEINRDGNDVDQSIDCWEDQATVTIPKYK